MPKCCYSYSHTEDAVTNTCPFNVPENTLISDGDDHWCLFHAPKNLTIIGLGAKESWGVDESDIFSKSLIKYAKTLFSVNDLELCGIVFPAETVLKGLSLRRVLLIEVEVVASSKSLMKRLAFEDCSFSEGVFIQNVVLEKGVIELKNSKLGNNKENSGNCFWISNSHINQLWFDGVMASTALIFKNSTFGELSIRDSTVSQYITVEECMIENKGIDFRNSYLNCHLRIKNTEVKGEAKFDAVTKEDADIENIIFENNKFYGCLSLSNRVFLNGAEFKNCDFYSAPKFHNTILHQDTKFYDSRFHDLRGESSNEYRTLKLAMENVRATREQGLFYALEQKCLRNSKQLNVIEKTVSFLYDEISDYGQNYIKPLFFILLLAFVFLGMYSFILNAWGIQSSLVEVLEFSFAQIFKPFNMWASGYVAPFENSPILLLKFLSATQSILSLILISLAVLGLRWQYKKN